MNIQIASPDQISKLLAFIAVKAKGTRFEIPASLLQNVESELRDFCKAHRITVQFKDASTGRVIVFCAAGAATGTVVGAMCGAWRVDRRAARECGRRSFSADAYYHLSGSG